MKRVGRFCRLTAAILTAGIIFSTQGLTAAAGTHGHRGSQVGTDRSRRGRAGGGPGRAGGRPGPGRAGGGPEPGRAGGRPGPGGRAGRGPSPGRAGGGPGTGCASCPAGPPPAGQLQCFCGTAGLERGYCGQPSLCGWGRGLGNFHKGQSDSDTRGCAGGNPVSG